MMLPVAALFGMPSEWIIIFVVALLLFGPNKMPELGRQLGKVMRDFRKLADEFTGATQSIHEEIAGAAGKLRNEVDSAYKPAVNVSENPTAGAQRPSPMLEDPMGLAPQLTVGAKTGGLKLSTSPDSFPEGVCASERSSLSVDEAARDRRLDSDPNPGPALNAGETGLEAPRG